MGEHLPRTIIVGVGEVAIPAADAGLARLVVVGLVLEDLLGSICG